MRPMASTCVASVISKAAPDIDNDPRCCMCQSVGTPSTALYWHIGETVHPVRQGHLAQGEGG